MQQGGSLTIGSGTLDAGTVAGGGGGSGRTPPAIPAIPAAAGGNGIFLQGNQTITFAPATGTTLTIMG